MAVGLAIMLTGCERGAVANPAQTWPASTAGRVCEFIEYGPVADVIGVRFDTAGGARANDTLSCVLTQAGHDFPELSLALTPTSTDEVLFRVLFAPPKSAAVASLGRAAYRAAIAPATPVNTGPAGTVTQAGPGIEIGWLSASSRLILLRYVAPAEVSSVGVATLIPMLIVLAQRIEARLVELSRATGRG